MQKHNEFILKITMLETGEEEYINNHCQLKPSSVITLQKGSVVINGCFCNRRV